MARSAPVWAVRAQLLEKLRPFVAGSPAAGQAPTTLLPEIHRHARGLSPDDLRMVLSAYSSRPIESTLVVKALQSRQYEEQSKISESISVEGMQELLVQLLVGGSRLGTALSLVESAEAIASFAPCHCRSAREFWPVFAERVARLAAAENLENTLMARAFAACSQWKQKCQDDVQWGHMLRTLGVHLAEPQRLDTLKLSEVVALAKNAALLGEPQVRLAAAIGHRVSGDARGSQDQLSSQDLIDLIGAAGHLGGKLHMMTRALADQLEPRTAMLSNTSLVQICLHLGALQMFPHRLAATLDLVLPARLQEQQFSLPERLKLLQAFGRLRWRSVDTLGPLLQSLPEDAGFQQLAVAALGGILYELYRLDVWDEKVALAVCSRLRMILFPTSTETCPAAIPCKSAANLLLALSYFGLPEKDLQQRLLQELLRSKRIPQEALYQLKTYEMAVRLGHAAVSWKDLGGLATRWLFSVRKAVGEPEGKTESQFAEEVSQVARNISWHHRAEVEVGPYLLDFAAVSKGDFEEEWDESKPGRSLARFCVAVEADGPTHFYRPHGSPYHWTSTSKFRHRLLSAMRIRVAHVPFYDWLQLEGLAQKEAYLTELLLKAHSTEFASLSIDKGAGVALTETSATSVASAMSGAGKKGSFIQRRVLARSRSVSEMSTT